MREASMAKGQQRSNREAKKPKKSAIEKAKPGATSSYNDPSRMSSKPISKKS
jgi:hypothetical protein